MSRESWNKREWRYDPETLASGWVEVLDEYNDPIVETGNVQVEFPWGNIPLQPDEDRDNGTAGNTGGGADDYGWSTTTKVISDVLNPALDNHIIATTGYANFPGYLDNYVGDGDTGLETVVPNVRGMLRVPGQNLIIASNLTYNRTYVNYDVTSIYVLGKEIQVVTDGDHELKSRDVVNVDYNNGDGYNGTWENVTIKDVPSSNSFVFDVPNPPVNEFNIGSYGWVWTNNRFIVGQSQEPGTIVDMGTEVAIRVLNWD